MSALACLIASSFATPAPSQDVPAAYIAPSLGSQARPTHMVEQLVVSHGYCYLLEQACYPAFIKWYPLFLSSRQRSLINECVARGRRAERGDTARAGRGE